MPYIVLLQQHKVSSAAFLFVFDIFNYVEILLFWCYQILLLVAKHIFFYFLIQTEIDLKGKLLSLMEAVYKHQDI